MTYGIDVWGRTGKKVFDISDISGRIVWSAPATAAESGSIVLSEIALKKIDPLFE